jgi:hypothetical protein
MPVSAKASINLSGSFSAQQEFKQHCQGSAINVIGILNDNDFIVAAAADRPSIAHVLETAASDAMALSI